MLFRSQIPSASQIHLDCNPAALTIAFDTEDGITVGNAPLDLLIELIHGLRLYDLPQNSLPSRCVVSHGVCCVDVSGSRKSEGLHVSINFSLIKKPSLSQPDMRPPIDPSPLRNRRHGLTPCLRQLFDGLAVGHGSGGLLLLSLPSGLEPQFNRVSDDPIHLQPVLIACSLELFPRARLERDLG